MKQIPIYFSFDDNYVVPAAVAFYSLLNRSKKSIFYNMYVLHSDITQENQNLLQDVINRFTNAKLYFIDTQNLLQDEWNVGNFEGHNRREQFTSDAIIRCFGHKFLPQCDKAIYSDVDVVFMDDISELYDIDIENSYIGAVKNPWMMCDKNELSHLSFENYKKLKDSYFGGGIWLMNFKKIRKDNLEEKMLSIIKDETIIKRWNDQDIMNIACDNKVTYIPLNYIAYPYMLQKITKEGFKSHFSRNELYDSIINPKIIHYAAWKPWNHNIAYSEVWWSIFCYLKLPKSKIFKDIDEPYKSEYIKARKKYRKYKKINLTISILLLFTIIYIFFISIQ